MTTLDTQGPLAVSVVAAIHLGDVDELRRLLGDHPYLAGTYLGDDGPDGMARSLLHIATDWPGHFPNVATTIAMLVAAGADVDARFRGPHRETPLHWAASSDDVQALTALLDAGANIEAGGGVIAGGTPLADATAFGQWNAARVLVAQGASATVFDLAALGMTEQVLAIVEQESSVPLDELNRAFWAACHGNQLATAQALAARGADLDWLPPWELATPLDIASRSGAHSVIRWLHGRGAQLSEQLHERPDEPDLP